jgi:hypothetical protein
MKKHIELLAILLLFIVCGNVYGQSDTQKYLINSWVSTFKTFDTGDTIANANEELHLQKDGSLTMKEKQMTLPGTWKYLKDTNQLQLTLDIAGSSETVVLEVDKSSNNELILTQRKGDRFMTKAYVLKE